MEVQISVMSGGWRADYNFRHDSLARGEGNHANPAREVGRGRAACKPGQVRKEAAVVSFARVVCSASHLSDNLVYK